MQESNSQIIIYQTESGETKLEVTFNDDTVWLTQMQLCELFNKSKATISEHIKHIFEEGELIENSVVRKFRTTAQDGKNYNTNFYNLDVIISVGYRVKSRQGTQFRIWATQRLKEYIHIYFITFCCSAIRPFFILFNLKYLYTSSFHKTQKLRISELFSKP